MHHKSIVKLYKWAVIHNASGKILICFIMIHSTYNSISLIIQTIWQKLLDSAITWIINIHSSCQSPMSCILIWSYQESKHDVPGQTSQNSQGLNLMDPSNERNLLLGMQETVKWFKQEGHVHVAASVECLLTILFLAQEFLSFT